mgnify:CR=1 FL=1
MGDHPLFNWARQLARLRLSRRPLWGRGFGGGRRRRAVEHAPALADLLAGGGDVVHLIDLLKQPSILESEASSFLEHLVLRKLHLEHVIEPNKDLQAIYDVVTGDELVHKAVEHLTFSGQDPEKLGQNYAQKRQHVQELLKEFVGHVRRGDYDSLRPANHVDAPPLQDVGSPDTADVEDPDEPDPKRPKVEPGGLGDPVEGNGLDPPPDVDGGGVHLPGDHYLGPGNPLQNGPPSDMVDAIARVHDYRYAAIMAMGLNPYTHYNIADAELLENLKSQTGVRAAAARAYFDLKKMLFPHLTLQATLPGVPSWAASQTESNMPGDDSNTGGVGGGQANLGVWAQGATFTDTAVTCYMTRRCYLPFNPDPVYEPITHRGRNAYKEGPYQMVMRHPVYGYKTPWHYPDLNALNLYFSPAEFQYLLEQYESIVPASMDILITDIIIKEVSQMNNTTQVADSGTGAIAILTDADYKYPYVLGTGQATLPPDIPTDMYLLPQYAYLTTGLIEGEHHEHHVATDNQVVIPNSDTDFYVLEHSHFTLHRTGDLFSHSYQFPEAKPKSLVGASQHFFLMENPLYDSRLKVLDRTGTNANWRHIAKDHYGSKPQNFFPGPLISSHTAYAHDGVAPRWGAWASEMQWLQTGTSVGDEPYARWSFRPGPACQPFSHTPADNPTEDQPSVGVDAVSWGLHENTSVDTPGLNRGRLPDDREQAKQLGGLDEKFWPVTRLNQALKEDQVSHARPLMPGSVWNERALHYESQIWAKIPRCDRSFMADSPMMGGWGFAAPPPMIFIKMLPTPAPLGTDTVTENTTEKAGILHQYAVFNLTVKLVFNLKKRTMTGRWNPQPAVYPPSARGHMPYVLYTPRDLPGNQHPDVYGHDGYERSEHCWTAKARVAHL